jgi:hypothetical protein
MTGFNTGELLSKRMGTIGTMGTMGTIGTIIESMDTMESIILRAQTSLSVGVPEEEVAARLQKQETPEITFLAIQAAKILIKDVNEENSDASCSVLQNV